MPLRTRVLVTPREIAGVAGGLQHGLRSRGVETDLLLRWPHPFRYQSAPPSHPLTRLLWTAMEVPVAGPRLVLRGRSLVSLVLRLICLPWFALRYRAVIYVGGETLLRHGLDRALLKKLGVRTITLFCGSDARPPYLNGYWLAPSAGLPDHEELRRLTSVTRQRVELAERQSSVVVNSPAMAQFHRRPYVEWCWLGLPGPNLPPPADVALPPDEKVPVRVLHAPSMTEHKGTTRIRAAVEFLRESGRSVDYVELNGLPHDVVLRELCRADIVVDELWSDALLAGLGTEAARQARPVVVCGYASDLVADIARRVGAPADHYVAPERLQERLTELVDDQVKRRDLGRRLYEFVDTVWASETIASRFEQLILAGPDPNWVTRPGENAYVHGWGMDEQDLVRGLREHVARYSVCGLELPPGPVLDAVRRLLDGASEA